MYKQWFINSIFLWQLLASFASAMEVDSARSSHNYSEKSSESLVDYLFRYKVLAFNKESGKIEINQDLDQKDKAFIWSHIKEAPQSPFALEVIYGDVYKSQAKKISKGLKIGFENYRGIASFEAYLEKARGEIEEKLQEGYKPVVMTFEETQQSDFILKTTLTGESLRLCGVTNTIEELIIEKMKEFLDTENMVPLTMYFYGSRVMPRTEVIKRDQEVIGNMATVSGTLKKNAVRVSGIAPISDLEMAVIFTSTEKFSQKTLTQMRHRFRNYVAQEFREYPVSANFFQYKEDRPLADPFSFLFKAFTEARGLFLSRHQFVEIK